MAQRGRKSTSPSTCRRDLADARFPDEVRESPRSTPSSRRGWSSRSPRACCSRSTQDEPHAPGVVDQGVAHRHRRLRRRLFLARPARTLPARSMKIDRSFVSSMESDQSDAAIVSSTIELSHRLGLEVIAEVSRRRLTWRACVPPAATSDRGISSAVRSRVIRSRQSPMRYRGDWVSDAGRTSFPFVAPADRIPLARCVGAERRLAPSCGPCRLQFSSASASRPSPNPRGQVTGVAPRIDGREARLGRGRREAPAPALRGSVVVRSHLRMNGRWRVRRRTDAAWRGSPWLVLRSREWEATQWNGPVLALGVAVAFAHSGRISLHPRREFPTSSPGSAGVTRPSSWARHSSTNASSQGSETCGSPKRSGTGACRRGRRSAT